MKKLNGEKRKTSNYYGVSKITTHNGYKSRIEYNKKNPWLASFGMGNDTPVMLGQFPTEREAAIAVDKKLISIGKIDKLNILKPKVT